MAVLSGKGGVGRSMLTAELGAQWAVRGKRVVLVDMNTGRRGLDMFFGLESRIGFDLGDVVDMQAALSKAIIEDRRTGVRMIAAKQFDVDTPMGERTLEIILGVLALQNDYVLLDGPPGMALGEDMTLRMAEASLVVATPDDMSLRDAERTVSRLLALGRQRPWLVVNRIQQALVAEGLQYEPAVCAQLLDLRLAGVIPEDPQALRSTLRKECFVCDTPAERAVSNLADRLEDMEIPLWMWKGEEADGKEPT